MNYPIFLYLFLLLVDYYVASIWIICFANEKSQSRKYSKSYFNLNKLIESYKTIDSNYNCFKIIFRLLNLQQLSRVPYTNLHQIF